MSSLTTTTWNMDFETELAGKLLRGPLPCKTRRQLRKKRIAEQIIKTISTLLEEGYNEILSPKQDYVHICEMFVLFENWKATPSNNELDNHFTKKITGYLLKICHYWWLNNLYVLNRTVQYYYRSHGDFREIIYGEIDECPTWRTLFNWGKWLPPALQANKSNNSPLLYFLTYYNRYSLVVHGSSFVDEPMSSTDLSLSPCEDCFLNAEPKKLLLLLQYGASVSGVGWNNRVEEFYCFCLLHEMVSSLWIDRGNANDHIPEIQHIILCSEYARKKLQCGRIITRAMPQITKYREFKHSEYVIKRLHTLTLLNYFPDVSRRFKDPCELKHICRMNVRYIVQYVCVGGLPQGLYNLGLPKHLANYLNLLDD